MNHMRLKYRVVDCLTVSPLRCSVMPSAIDRIRYGAQSKTRPIRPHVPRPEHDNATRLSPTRTSLLFADEVTDGVGPGEAARSSCLPTRGLLPGDAGSETRNPESQN